MARPVLTEYLLKLATDYNEIVRFRASKAEATKSMEDAKLSPDQREAVLSGDWDRLQKAVNEELKSIHSAVASEVAITAITHTVGLKIPHIPKE
jgi:hypothetical protein